LGASWNISYFSCWGAVAQFEGLGTAGSSSG